MKLKRYRIWYVIAFGFVILFLLMLLSSILDVSDRLFIISPYLSYGFIGVVVILVYLLLLRPLSIIALKHPRRIVLKEGDLSAYVKMKKVLVSLDYIHEDTKKRL
jgi:hypothetical protein